MNYRVIGDEEAVLGFGMVGVKGYAVSTKEETAAAFDQAISDADVGIIIMTETAADLIRNRVDRYLFSREFPLIVEIPGRGGRDPNRPGLREMVNKAIGIHV
jgi:V/A-type H+/Na+-transporting ATPase subunit F